VLLLPAGLLVLKLSIHEKEMYTMPLYQLFTRVRTGLGFSSDMKTRFDGGFAASFFSFTAAEPEPDIDFITLHIH
jgi:hypothetical protein